MNKTISFYLFSIFITMLFCQSSFAGLPVNASCGFDSECESDVCNVITRKCANIGKIDSPCGLDSECESKMCDTSTLKCTSTRNIALGRPRFLIKRDVEWLNNLVKANNGNEFCMPENTTVKEGFEALHKFWKVHPEIHGTLTDDQAVQALFESYPCGRKGNPGPTRTQQAKTGTNAGQTAPVANTEQARPVTRAEQAAPAYEKQYIHAGYVSRLKKRPEQTESLP